LDRALSAIPRLPEWTSHCPNLDANCASRWRSEIKRFHQDFDATIIYVTHDQREAVTMPTKWRDETAAPAAIRRPSRVFRKSGELVRRQFIGSRR